MKLKDYFLDIMFVIFVTALMASSVRLTKVHEFAIWVAFAVGGICYFNVAQKKEYAKKALDKNLPCAKRRST